MISAIDLKYHVRSGFNDFNLSQKIAGTFQYNKYQWRVYRGSQHCLDYVDAPERQTSSRSQMEHVFQWRSIIQYNSIVFNMRIIPINPYKSNKQLPSRNLCFSLLSRFQS